VHDQGAARQAQQQVFRPPLHLEYALAASVACRSALTGQRRRGSCTSAARMRAAQLRFDAAPRGFDFGKFGQSGLAIGRSLGAAPT